MRRTFMAAETEVNKYRVRTDERCVMTGKSIEIFRFGSAKYVKFEENILKYQYFSHGIQV